MPVSASTLAKLMAAGLSGQDLIDVVASIDADMETSAPIKSRSAGAIRQERYRNRKASQSVTSDVTRDVTEGNAALPPSPGPLDPPLPDPPPYNPPNPIHHPGKKTREPAPGRLGSAGNVGTVGARSGPFRSQGTARSRQVPRFLGEQGRQGRGKARLGGDLAELDPQLQRLSRAAAGHRRRRIGPGRTRPGEHGGFHVEDFGTGKAARR